MHKYVFILFLNIVSVFVHAQTWQEMMENPQKYSYYETKAAFDKEWAGKPYVKHQGLKQFYRYETFMLKNMNAEGFYRPDVQESSFQKYYKNYKINGPSLRTVAASWQPIGPFNSPGGKGTNNDGIGRVQVLGFHPSDTNTLWAGSSSGGLWKTVDNGTTWAYQSFSWTGSQVVSDIHVASSSVLYVATSDYNRIDYSTSSVLKSTDGGTSWQVQTSKVGTYVSIIYRLLVHPTNPNIMFLGTNRGLYRSANEGLTWTLIGTQTTINDLEFKPGDPNTVYAAGPSVFYKSTDAGLTFSSQSLNLTGTPVRTAMAVSPSAPNNVYLATTNNYRFGGFHISTDGGSNFTLKTLPTANIYKASGTSSYTASQFFGGQTSYDWCLQVSPTDPNKAFLGGVSLAYTTNTGNTWTQADEYIIVMGEESTTIPPHVDYHFIGFQPGTNKPWVGCDGGVYKSLPAPAAGKAQEWISRNESLNITETYRIAVAMDGSKIVEGTQDNGVHAYVGAADWQYLSIGDGFDCQIDPRDTRTVYYSTQMGYLYKRSASTGEVDLFSPDQTGETAPFHTKLYMDYRNPDVLYTVHKNLWKTTNGGSSWKNITGNSLVISSPETFAIAPSDSKVIYFTDGTEFYRSGSAGESGWGGNSVTFTATDLVVHDTSASKLWASAIGKVYESVNGGQTWTDISGNLPNITINAIVHVPGTSNELYVATNFGVFFKANNTSTWELFSTNMPRVMVYDLVINTCTRKLYAATYGRGVWQVDVVMPTNVCCPKMPEVTLSSNKICSGTNATLSLTQPLASGTVPVWYKDGAALSQTGTALQINAAGSYSVLLSSKGCNTYPTANYLVQSIQSTKETPLCYDNEGPIEVDVETGSNPLLGIQNISGCATRGLKALGIKPQFSSSNAMPAVYTKQLDLQYMTGHKLSFDVAYVRSYSNAGTALKVYISGDCGKTFTSLFDKKNDELESSSTFNISDWTPATCAEWKTFEIDLKNYVSANTIFKFELSKSDPDPSYYWGNNLYLDNICVNGVSLGVEEDALNNLVQVFPNPAIQHVEVKTPYEVKSIQAFSVQGQFLGQLSNTNQGYDISGLDPGLYHLEIRTDHGVFRRKLTIAE